jgi:hypothetical protein
MGDGGRFYGADKMRSTAGKDEALAPPMPIYSTRKRMKAQYVVVIS